MLTARVAKFCEEPSEIFPIIIYFPEINSYYYPFLGQYSFLENTSIHPLNRFKAKRIKISSVQKAVGPLGKKQRLFPYMRSFPIPRAGDWAWWVNQSDLLPWLCSHLFPSHLRAWTGGDNRARALLSAVFCPGPQRKQSVWVLCHDIISHQSTQRRWSRFCEGSQP